MQSVLHLETDSEARYVPKRALIVDVHWKWNSIYINEKTLVLTETTKDLLRAPNSVYIRSMERISFCWNKTIKVLHLLRLNGQLFFVTKKPDFHINSLKCCCIAYGVIFFTVVLFSLLFCLESHIAQSNSEIILKSEKPIVFSLKCFEIYM